MEVGKQLVGFIWTSLSLFSLSNLLWRAQILQQRNPVFTAKVDKFDMFHAVIEEYSCKRQREIRWLERHFVLLCLEKGGLSHTLSNKGSVMIRAHLCSWGWHSSWRSAGTRSLTGADRPDHTARRQSSPNGRPVPAASVGWGSCLWRSERPAGCHAGWAVEGRGHYQFEPNL